MRFLIVAMALLAPHPLLAASEEPEAPPAEGSSTPVPEATPPVPAPDPAATPYPMQDPPPPDADPSGSADPGLGDYDAAIRVPGEPPPERAVPDEALPDDHDTFLQGKEDRWDPKRIFPGNYYSLPLSVDVGWRPCLECAPEGGNLYRRPGEFSLWTGYAFQPWERSSAPFMAGGLEWILAESDADGRTRSRSQLRPTWRTGWSFTAASIYASAGVILPDQDRRRVGFHAGVGASSVAVLLLAACAAEAIPSVVEVGYDWLPDPQTDRLQKRFTLKVGWGF